MQGLRHWQQPASRRQLCNRNCVRTMTVCRALEPYIYHDAAMLKYATLLLCCRRLWQCWLWWQ